MRQNILTGAVMIALAIVFIQSYTPFMGRQAKGIAILDKGPFVVYQNAGADRLTITLDNPFDVINMDLKDRQNRSVMIDPKPNREGWQVDLKKIPVGMYTLTLDGAGECFAVNVAHR
ncbi:MAG: hypothetical protein KDC57_04800 [Saprospiraceae bacterium]|nr:hypothetical protein [Saprospiraceae bacterium]